MSNLGVSVSLEFWSKSIFIFEIFYSKYGKLVLLDNFSGINDNIRHRK